MSDRAIEMAQIIRAEWADETEALGDFCVRRFPNDRIGDVKRALDICLEMEHIDYADEVVEGMA